MTNNIQMKITNPEKHIQTTPEINQRFSDKEKEKIASAARDFESLLTSMMLKSMTSTTNGFFGEESYGGDFFDTVFESELSSFLSRGKGFGVADMIYKKTTGEEMSPFLGKVKLNSLRSVPQFDIKNHDKGVPALNPSQESINRLKKYEPFIDEASNSYGIDKNIIRSIILTESAAQESAQSKAKAKGLMQLIDSTAAEMGVQNVWDPRENILGGTKYLAEMLRQYNGNLKLSLAAYNAGPANVNKYNGIPPFEETRNYVVRVMGYMNYFNG